MKITCPSCGRVVPGADIDLPAKLAVCRACSEVISLTALAAAPAPASAPFAPPSSALAFPAPDRSLHAAPRPHDLLWDEASLGSGRAAQLRPSRLKAVPTALFAAVWNGFIAFVYAMILAHMTHPAVLLAPSLHAAAGLAILYMALRQLLNRARLTLDAQGFRLELGPVPQRGGVRQPLENIARFAATEREVAGRGQRAGWVVTLVTRENVSISLALPLRHRDEAEFVAARLNQWLEELRAPGSYRALPG